MPPAADAPLADPSTAEARKAFRISFVCTGNICRSPMAEVVMSTLVARAGLARRILTTSGATGDWHVGEQADPRARRALERRGYDGSRHRARQFDPASFGDLDLVVAHDRGHLRILRSWAPTETDRSKVQLLLSFDREQTAVDVPDPYYSDDATFDAILGMIEASCRVLLRQIAPAVR